MPSPAFSRDHGFYNTPFYLTITFQDPSAEIYYTTNGSLPGISKGKKYTAPVKVQSTTVMRAVAIKQGQVLSKVTTCTYLFYNDIVHQPVNPPGYPLKWGPYTGISGTAIADYEMDPELLADSTSIAGLITAMKSLPVISLVTDKGYLFSLSQNPDTGGIYIYTGPPLTNTTNGLGSGWERPVSFEYFDASDSVSLQVDCGLQLHGGHSRRPEKSPKHSFRLVFRSIYGPPKFLFPIFGKNAEPELDAIVLRAGFNNSWVHHISDERVRAQYIYDAWAKDTQREMGYKSSNGIFVHLFINGLYWGIYNPSEKLDKEFAASYLGGNEEDYDVIKDYSEVVDGDISSWNNLISMANAGLSGDAAYQKIIGNNPDGTPAQEIEPMVDAVNLADYMILNFYAGNSDWDHHNWVAMRNRVNPGKGFRFFCWDEEKILEDINANILNENNTNCPSRVFQQLRQNPDFRRLFADRIQKMCFEDGVLTPGSAAERWNERAGQIKDAVAAEAARWGDYRRDVHRWQTAGPFDVYTFSDYWLTQNDFMTSTYFPNRTGIFLEQLRNAGLFPHVNAPSFRINNIPVSGKAITSGDVLSMSAEEGIIYYTTDGSDPVTWKPAAVVSAKAARYTGPLTLKESSHIKARTFFNGVWSAVNDRFFIVPEDFIDIKITEIQYHPLEQDAIDNSEFEFIEIKNTGTSTLDIGGFRFIDGIKYEFPAETQFGPKKFIVLASDTKYFYMRYGFVPFDEFDGQLENNGERVILLTAENDTICSITYSDSNGWPEIPDGSGKSLVPYETDPSNDQNRPQFWRTSYYTGGSPGADDILTAENGTKPELVTLFQNYPNPFADYTNILYFLNDNGYINLSVYNILGQRIIILKNEYGQAGYNYALWEGLDQNGDIVANGIYFLRIEVKAGNGRRMVTRKMIFTR